MYMQDGLTALHIACIKGNVEILQLFIQAGCNHIIDVLAKVGGSHSYSYYSGPLSAWVPLYLNC